MGVSQINEHRIRESSPERYVTETPAAILERRLIEGEHRIAAAEERGDDISRLVDFWIELLHQYEQTVDAYSEAA